MVDIEINGKKLQVRQGAMVIEAADEAGITIPRFCYHKKLSVAANCRMCLVEVEKVGKPLPACATPVTDGMRVFTKSARALEAQKSVMEFLLINHPLDCPICDQGGECDLQDIAVGYGKDISRFTEKKRVVPDKNIGPLIATEMTRCIHCTRCVRFGQEIAGIMELGAAGRGEHTRIGTYVERAVNSEMSGNVIDLCPVGALTSKPYRYTGRPWENQSHDSIAPHDCVGSNVNVETRRNQVMRVLPSENEAINELWLSDRDRYSYLGLYHEQRVRQPMIKQGDDWKSVDWQVALSYAAEGINTVIAKDGAGQLGSLLSPTATVEELYLAQKLLRGLGSNNIDHRLHQQNFTDQDIAPAYPGLGQAISNLESIDAGLLIGSCVRKDQPIIAHRLRKAALKGAKIMAVNAIDYDFNFPLAESVITRPAEMVQALAGIVKALLTISGEAAATGLDAKLENIESHDVHLDIAKHLHSAENTTVLIGTQALTQNELPELRALANEIARLTNSKLGYLTEGANATGAWIAGAIPHRGVAGEDVAPAGKHAAEMMAEGMKAFINLGVEPEFDCASPTQAIQTMQDADFVVCMSAFATDAMRDYADVILPVAPYTESSGTFINIEGKWQSFAGSVTPLDEARPAWKVLRVLGNVFELPGFDYVSSEQVRDELQNKAASISTESRSEWRCPQSLHAEDKGLQRIGHLPIYAVDALVRRSQPLQDTADAIVAAIYLNSMTAAQTGVAQSDSAVAAQGDSSVRLPVVIDEAVPDNCVLIPSSIPGTEQLGVANGPIEISAS